MAADDLSYFRARAVKAREMAAAAIDPAIASIHARMATDYERRSERLAFETIRARPRQNV